MHVVYESRNGSLVPHKDVGAIGAGAVWIDLFNPTAEEEALVERALGHDIPTREELHEIEESSRLYQTDDTYVMTITVLYQADLPHPSTTNITFILSGSRLVTIRYAEPRAFALFSARCEKPEGKLTSGVAVLVGLFELVVDRLADFVERVQGEVDGLSHTIFEMRGGTGTRQRRFDIILKQIGREGEVTSRARDSLVSLARALTFLTQACKARKDESAITARVRSMLRDVQALSDHVGFQSSKITFLLNATLGMIQIEQNDIIKIFSVAAVVFLPPTLIASIYGMNFHLMPELDWRFGYPLAIGLMVASAVLPYLFFKRKGWL